MRFQRRRRESERGRWRQPRGGADDDDVDGMYAYADVGCKERDQFGRLMGGEEEDRTPSTSVGGGRGDKRGDDRCRGGDRPSFSITRLNLLSQFFACPIFFSTAIR